MKVGEAIDSAVRDAGVLYHRLVLVVGPPRSGKTSSLREAAAVHGWQVVCLNLRLSERLLELTKRQRAISVSRLVDEIVREESPDIAALDNIELLFDPELAVDPLRVLQGLARDRTIVVAWPGSFDGTTLTYATPGHPESKRYGQPDAIIVATDRPGGSGHYQEQA